MTPTGAPDQLSDEGLAAERTALAWVRMGMTLLGLPAALLAYSFGRSGLALASAALAGLAGLGLLLISLRKREAAAGPALRLGHLAVAQVALTGASATLICLAGLALVLSPQV